MRIGFYMTCRHSEPGRSPGGSPLQYAMELALRDMGHFVETFDHRNGYDLVLVWQQVSHNPDYYFPLPFPSPSIPIAFIDASEHGYGTRYSDRVMNYAYSFTETVMRQSQKNYDEQVKLKEMLSGRSFPYFLREMSTFVKYPDSYYPIDYPLPRASGCDIRPDREEYLSRDLELFCSWGESHPFRVHLTQELRDAHRKAEITIIDRGKGVFIPQDVYFCRMRAAKCSVSYDGYGSGSFRMTEVLVRTCLLQGPLSIVTRAPLVDGITCRAYNVEHTNDIYNGSNIADVLRRTLECPEESYEIYERAYEHCMTHLTERATAQYVLDTVAAHDYSKRTPLELPQ